jgi:putative DNA primase/helicase
LNKQVAEFVGILRRDDHKTGNWMDESTKRKLNLQNGVLDLATFTILPHSSDFGFRHILPYSYDDSAKCPRFDKFLKEVTLNRQDLEDILLEFMGYAISGDDCWIHKALVLIGEGGNGKSTLNKVLKSLVPKDTGYSALTMSALNHATNRTMLEGRLFNIGDENSPKSFMNNDTFKSLVSGDDVDVKHLYAQPYTIRNRAKMIFNCNKMPDSDDNTNAMIRRLLFVPFDAQFDSGSENTDLHIDTKLAAELPGILNRCIEGYLRLKKQGDFTKSLSSEDILEDYKVNSLSAEAWFVDNIEKGHGFVDINKEIYPAYVQSCHRSDTSPESRLNFGRIITKLCAKRGFDKKRVEENGIKYQRIIGAKLKSGF